MSNKIICWANEIEESISNEINEKWPMNNGKTNQIAVLIKITFYEIKLSSPDDQVGSAE